MISCKFIELTIFQSVAQRKIRAETICPVVSVTLFTGNLRLKLKRKSHSRIKILRRISFNMAGLLRNSDINLYLYMLGIITCILHN